MITLTESQNDALTEVCNIGMSKAAKQLSILLKDEIDMHVPHVEIIPAELAADQLGIKKDQRVICVQQSIDGALGGEALLFFHDEDSASLINSLLGDLANYAPITEKREFEHEAMMEIGNIIISACLGTLANFLKEEIILSVPRYSENTAESIISINIAELESPDKKTALMAITTILEASNRDVTGTLIIMYTLKSIQHLIALIDDMIDVR